MSPEPQTRRLIHAIRRNRVRQELAETYKTSQPTISRANSRITSRLATVLAPFVPAVEDLDPDTQYIYDGTLLPCWSWRGHPELYSGKHKTTGENVQVACNLYGELAWISDAIDGSRHDAHCIDESRAPVTLRPRRPPCLRNRPHRGDHRSTWPIWQGIPVAARPRRTQVRGPCSGTPALIVLVMPAAT
jgi:hypothetical protein